MSSDQRALTAETAAVQEHRRVNDVPAKAVVPYGFDGANLLPATTEQAALQIDTTSTASTVYVGTAATGALTSAASWQVYRISTSGGVAITWANGNSKFANVWDNRASLVYS